jgi:hypothetical protein
MISYRVVLSARRIYNMFWSPIDRISTHTSMILALRSRKSYGHSPLVRARRGTLRLRAHAGRKHRPRENDVLAQCVVLHTFGQRHRRGRALRRRLEPREREGRAPRWKHWRRPVSGDARLRERRTRAQPSTRAGSRSRRSPRRQT